MNRFSWAGAPLPTADRRLPDLLHRELSGFDDRLHARHELIGDGAVADQFIADVKKYLESFDSVQV